MVLLTVGDHVWIPSESDSPISTPIGAEVIDVSNPDGIQVVDDEDRRLFLTSDVHIRLMHPKSIIGVEDLAELEDIHEASVLRNLFTRYNQDKIYSFCGDYLISLNPHKNLDIYNHSFRRCYRNRQLGELEPHVFAIAETAFCGLLESKNNQSIIIGGESGSGKSETLKRILEYLSDGGRSWDQIRASSHLIEAFGNAKTSANQNSSRFAKYIDIYYNSTGSLEGAEITQYLMETQRVVCSTAEKRNFHIFYMIVNGLSEEKKKELHLDRKDYFILNQGEETESDDNYNEQLSQVLRAFEIIEEKEVDSTIRSLAAILNLGDLEYQTRVAKNMETTQIGDPGQINAIAELLEVDRDLLSKVMTSCSISVRDETVFRNLTAQKALDIRDSLMRNIYSGIFKYIAKKINTILRPKSDLKDFKKLGILDIFGFENLKQNRFEQLCINYTNEALEQLFIRHLCKLEQLEYETQKIIWHPFEFKDNVKTLDLLANGPTSIISLINEESVFPEGSDQSILFKMHHHHSQSEVYLKPKSDLSQCFAIKHYAGTVFYNTRGFMEKNKDQLPLDIRTLLSESKSTFVQGLVNHSEGEGRDKTSVLRSLKKSLDSLMVQLDNRNLYFIRCINPNDKQQSDHFDRACVVKQLRYTGLLDLVIMRNAGYPVRKKYSEFVDAFRGLLPGIRPSRYENCIEATSRILTVILGEEADFQLGKTKVFMKRGDYMYIDKERHKMQNFFAASIQKHLKGWIQKRKYEKIRMASLVIQKYWRGYTQRRNYQTILNGIVRLQAILRSHQLVARFTALTEYTIRLQALCRGYLARKLLKEKKKKKSKKTSESIPEDPVTKTITTKTIEPNYPEDNSDYSFEKYAVTNFQRENSSYLRGIISSTLLRHSSPINNISAKILWKQICRFAGDLPESQTDMNKSQQNIIDIIYQVLNSTELIENEDYCKEAYPNYFERPFTGMEYVQTIISHGTLRPELRDEIYCQIIKQINRNFTSTSNQYWTLLALISSSFSPSEDLIPYVNHFTKQFSSINPAYPTVRNHLDKCFSKGNRLQPPSILEFEAIKNFKQILLPITFSDGTTHQFIVDSYTTAYELCAQVMTMIGLKDKFGFSLYLSLNETASSLGAGADFIFDAISVCEREGIKKGHQFDNIPWRLLYRKEIFSPWHSSSLDTVASNLIYEQIIRGFHYGEYECSDENEVILLAVQHYFVLNDGAEIDVNGLENNLKVILPISIIKEDGFQPEMWLQKIMNIYRKTYMRANLSADDVKAQVIDFAKVKWATAFSRLFNAQQLNGLGIPDANIVIAINAEGVNVIDNKNEVICDVSYDEIENVVVNSSNTLSIQTIGDDEYKFLAKHAVNMKELINFFINGIKKRSKYLIALETIDNKKFLSCEMGDVLYMNKPEERRNAVIVECVNTKTNEKGMVPVNKLVVLATLKGPNRKVIQLYQQPNQFKNKPANEIGNEQTIIMYDNSTLKLVHLTKQHTLQDFASAHFFSKSEAMVRYGNIPLTEPLLKTSRANDELREKAIKMYIDVMRFMGDLPWSQSIHSLVDSIFSSPLANEPLRDELYCQVTKQLNGNPNISSEQRGWKLMWLALGLFPPTTPLYKELDQIFRSKQSLRGRECLDRLVRIMGVLKPRKTPPHYVEVDSVLANRTEIFHKFHLPDGSSEITRIESTDLCHHVAERIANTKKMNSKGCSIFIKINEKVMSLPENEYVFDYLRQIAECMKPSEPRVLSYKLLLMKKIWTEVNPGDDLQGDIVLHFPQELPKYLRGYYNIKEEEVTRLAALIMRAKTNEHSEIPIKHIPQVLPEILPNDYIKKHSNNEWRKAISKECLKLPKMSTSDSKVAFLKELYKLPTFGSAFFEVKQTSDPSIPAKINLAINKQGVSVFNPETKQIIVQYPYTGIVNWTAGNTYFHMTTGNMIKGGRLLVETTLGYKIDDLLSSYIQIVCETSIRKSHTA
ncbi:unnamed protein product [Bursaphelenchus xylophilus]|uniref:(pine wood nematode) hypothetical protein n=1 Tax=Bursaphelenchus xylophilus TaxID=6326 RepID=A0A1I7SMT3_BURXY|nr:unnamed protein product [Bursaphelenchus xylophilus]CAG9130362.1 unnamed protein product [Bursaphelenchus xylophilus]